jgi:uncharacterized membrane protein
MWLARELGGEASFELAFGLLMGACALATLAGVARLGGPRAAWLFALMPALAGAVLRTHFDLLAAALLVAALWAVAARRPVLAFALLGVGAMTKLFPAVLVPVLVAWMAGRGEWRRALVCVAVFAAVVLAISAPFLGGGYADSYRFHLDRPIQVESTPAVVLYALGGARVTGTTTTPDAYKSNGLVGGAADAVRAVFTALGLLAIALIAWLAWRRAQTEEDALVCCAAAVVAFVALNKVLSPQYVAWLAPLAALCLAWRCRAAAVLLVAAIALTQVEFPRRYALLVEGDAATRLIVAARDLVLLAALGALIARAAGAARSPAPGAAAARSGSAPP